MAQAMRWTLNVLTPVLIVRYLRPSRLPHVEASTAQALCLLRRLPMASSSPTSMATSALVNSVRGMFGGSADPLTSTILDMSPP